MIAVAWKVNPRLSALVRRNMVGFAEPAAR
jgi:hypothetical protein